jgi:predicted Rossmann fold flavoprotein
METTPNTIYDVIVIGGGASGMMAAGVAAERGKKVLLLEKNGELGKKLKITGGGRCNITNNEPDVRKLLSHYGPAADYLYSAFAQFGVTDTFTFFESRGLPLVTQNLQRVFPKSEKALDVYRVMESFVQNENITIKMGTSVRDVIKNENEIIGVYTNNGQYFAKNIVLSSGGQSHPETGSTGDGFKLLRKIGHKVSDSTPGLVPLAVSDSWVKSLSGTSLDETKITFFVDDIKSFSKKGRILFTHFGLSGPLILNSSKKVSDLLHEGLVTATIDIFPATDFNILEKKIIETFDNNKNKLFKNVIKEILPEGLSVGVLELLEKVKHNWPETKVHSITKEDRKRILHLLKAMPVNIDGLMGYDKAVVADGGLDLNEIDMKKCQSKIYPNLYVTGDIFDISRPSGGYSLQLCWTSGYVVGKNVN